MITVNDVLAILKAFEDVKDSKALSQDAKVLIVRELLASVPQEIVAPHCKNTSEAIRGIIHEYLGIKRPKAEEAKSEIGTSENANAPARAEASREPQADAVVEGPRVARETISPVKGQNTGPRKTRRGS